MGFYESIFKCGCVCLTSTYGDEPYYVSCDKHATEDFDLNRQQRQIGDVFYYDLGWFWRIHGKPLRIMSMANLQNYSYQVELIDDIKTVNTINIARLRVKRDYLPDLVEHTKRYYSQFGDEPSWKPSVDHPGYYDIITQYTKPSPQYASRDELYHGCVARWDYGTNRIIHAITKKPINNMSEITEEDERRAKCGKYNRKTGTWTYPPPHIEMVGWQGM